MPVTFSNLISRQAAWNLSAANARLGESILRLSSGLKIQRPQDGTFEYIRGASLQGSSRLYEGMRSNLSEYRSILSVASEAGAEIRDALASMKEKSVAAEDPSLTTDERSLLFAEFDTLRDTVDNIVQSANYNGGGVLNAAGTYQVNQTVSVSPDRSVTMDLNLESLDVSAAGPGGIVIDSTAWSDETDAAASTTEIDTALAKVDKFLGQAGADLNAVDGHIRMADSAIQNYAAARSSLIEIDAAEEMVNFTSLDVIKQAAQSVLVQANLSQRSILNLYEFNYSS